MYLEFDLILQIFKMKNRKNIKRSYIVYLSYNLTFVYLKFLIHDIHSYPKHLYIDFWIYVLYIGLTEIFLWKLIVMESRAMTKGLLLGK